MGKSHIRQTCLVCWSSIFLVGHVQTWELTAISITPYKFFSHFMVQVVKLRVHTFCIFPGHFKFHQYLSVWQKSLLVWAKKKNSIHLLFLSRQLLTFFQSFSLMVFNLVLHMVRCLISDFLTGT